jgi:hypothetical protein
MGISRFIGGHLARYFIPQVWQTSGLGGTSDMVTGVCMLPILWTVIHSKRFEEVST